jgi:hypothetical protein
MPDGSPVPELLLESRAIVFLRLDTDGPADPARALKYYRDKGLLHGTRIGKKVRYAKRELLQVDAIYRPPAAQAFRLIQPGTTPATTAVQVLTAGPQYGICGFHLVTQCKKSMCAVQDVQNIQSACPHVYKGCYIQGLGHLRNIYINL